MFFFDKSKSIKILNIFSFMLSPIKKDEGCPRHSVDQILRPAHKISLSTHIIHCFMKKSIVINLNLLKIKIIIKNCLFLQHGIKRLGVSTYYIVEMKMNEV